jgi:hypothetical protein
MCCGGRANGGRLRRAVADAVPRLHGGVNSKERLLPRHGGAMLRHGRCAALTVWQAKPMFDES